MPTFEIWKQNMAAKCRGVTLPTGNGFDRKGLRNGWLVATMQLELSKCSKKHFKNKITWDSELKTSGKLTTALALKNGYTYNFEWLGKKIIQFPEDIVNLQMIIYESKPDIIIETGVANGGSALFFASMLAINEMMGCYKKSPKYIGLDINTKKHCWWAKIFLQQIYWTSECDTSNPVAEEISHLIKDNERIMVVLDLAILKST